MTNQPTQTGADRPVDMIIFGGGGAARKLLPALYMAHLHCNLPPETRIIAVGRRDWGIDGYRKFMDEQSRPFIDEKAFDQAAWSRFLDLFKYVLIDVNAPDDYLRLAEAARGDAIRVFYLSTSPELFTTICDNLSAAHLVDKHSRVVLEKPLGHDLASAKAINDAVGKHFEESQIYRIDHYLGKETVQNLMVLRFGNPIFGPLWQAPSIRSVQITVAETVGVGSRAGFYDHTGALRDMVQNHLLQLLCIVAMEPPVSLDPDAVRDEAEGAALAAADGGGRRRARHGARPVHGRRGRRPAGEGLSRGRQRAGRQPRGNLRRCAHINNWRWANVPFFLRTGKRLQRRQSEIVIEFADMPFSIIPTGPRHYSNRLVIQLQPEESIQLQMLAKEPGSGMNMVPVSLNLDLQQAIPERRAEAYERLLIDVIRGRLTHFMRRDELEAAWSWVEPILDGWKQLGDRPRLYTAGTFGRSRATGCPRRGVTATRRRAGVRHAGSHAKSHGA